jgi:exodeoxyribonuclease-3
MKITTWNVNGLRAAIAKGFMDWNEIARPDVLCLQEIKARPAQLEADHRHALEAAYAEITWNPAERPGYSGVATLARTPALWTRPGLDREAFDREGRAITSCYPGFYLFNLYFPNGQHDLGRVPFKLDFYARLLEICDELHAAGQSVILTGDFNTAHRPIDLRHPKENEGATGFLPEERAWVDRYLEHGFVDIYRQLYPERVQYTWWTYISFARRRNVGWRLDYFLISPALVERVQDVIIHDDVLGSDHCPVSLILKD